jgi:hypothetical protein
MTYKNIDPTIWGPHLWKFMHYFTLSYPDNPTDEDKDILYNFFHTIQTVLPCEKCRYNFKSHLETTPLTDEVLSSNINVVKWLFNIHNEVNKYTNKPIMSYDEFIKVYSTNKNHKIDNQDKINNQDKNNIINKIKNNKTIILILIILVIILIVYIHKKFN